MPWTSSYTVPTTYSQESAPSIFAVTVFGDVWLFSQSFDDDLDRRKVDLIVFKTDTRQMIKVPITFPDNFGIIVKMCVSHRNKVYLTVYQDYLTMAYKIFELDPVSMVFEVVLTTERSFWQAPMFVENQMYLIFYDEDSVAWMTINLETKKVVSQVSVNLPNYAFQTLMINDGKLYTTGRSGSVRYVSVWNTDGFVEVCRGAHVNSDAPPYSSDINIIEIPDDASFWSVKENSLYLDKFNFKSMQWMQQVIPKGWQGDSMCMVRSCTGLDGTLYVVICNRELQNRDFELRMYERRPSLSTLCALSVVDHLLETPDDREKVENGLPMKIRNDITNMFDWRVYEIEKVRKWEFLNKYQDACHAEIDQMEYEGMIDGDLRKNLMRILGSVE